MTQIDKLLLLLVAQKQHEINTLVPSREAGVLRSLSTSVTSPLFITENQSKLLGKILRDNHQHFGDMSAEIVESLADPQWSKPFRMLEQVKKLYITTPFDNAELTLVAEFTFSAHIRKKLTQATKDIENLVQAGNGRMYYAELTERNIVTLVDLLRPFDFDIDPLVMSHYDTIKSWNESEVRTQFQITSMTNQNFQKHITADLGITTSIDQNIIHDRSMRYRYFNTDKLELDGSLTREIAMRTRPRMWVNKDHSMTELIGSLAELKRLPLMVVFENFEHVKSYQVLEALSEALDANGITDGIGVYFRLPNDANGIKFNELVAEKRYNQYLDTDTKVVCVQSGKIPKFFLTSTWRPMSVIAVDAQMRSSKTAVYASCCDLVISYSDAPPMIETTKEWL